MALDPENAPKLLSGDNPQIAKDEGDAPVQAYLAALPGWKGEVARHMDAVIVRTVPDVQKAVKWNTPFYGVEPREWFLGFHELSRHDRSSDGQTRNRAAHSTIGVGRRPNAG